MNPPPACPSRRGGGVLCRRGPRRTGPMIVRPCRPAVALAALAAAGLAAGLALGDPLRGYPALQRDAFDGKEPLWARGPASVPAVEEAHALTAQHAHSLPTSEYLRVKADANGELNPFVYYSYPTHPAPVADDMTVRVWVRANRPGVQLLARVVLPRERNPDKPGEPLTVLLRGEAYTVAGGFWQPLELRRPARLLKEEQQTLRTKLQRDVTIDGAYVDRVVLNLYAGPGVTEAWVDDLEVGPVIEPVSPPSVAGGKTPAGGKLPTPAQTTSRANIPPTAPLVTPVPPPVQSPKGARVAVEFNR